MAFYLICSTIAVLLNALLLVLFVRAILSWVVPPGGGGRFVEILEQITEFVVAPIRKFLERFEFVRRIPLDVSYLVAFLLVDILSGFFSAISMTFM